MTKASPSFKSWLDGLNPEQQEAVLHNEGPLLILAGAGSGKTTVLVSRAGRLIDEGKTVPDALCVLTFTNKAARELKTRVSNRIGQRAKKLWAGTFHSFGLQILRKYHKEAHLIREFGVLDPQDSIAIAKEILKGFKHPDKEAYDGDTLIAMMSQWQEDGRREAKTEDPYESAVEWLLPKLEKRYESLGVVDFDRLILKPIELMEKHPEILQAVQDKVQYLMVDEFQDTNRAQMRLVKLLSDRNKNISVVGDDDQSIYGWRGACVENILNFPKQYEKCKIVRLERNYRSTPQILEIANAVIAKNKHRHPKVLKATIDSALGTTPELIVSEDENEEVEHVSTEIHEFTKQGISLKNIAVLYRSNGQGAVLEAELRKQGTPYRITGGTGFFDRKETRDILAYLRTAFRPNDVSIRRILNVPSRGIGDTTVEKLTKHSECHGLRFIEALRSWEKAGLDERSGRAINHFFEELKPLIPRILAKKEGTFGETLVKYFEEIGYKTHIEKHSANLGSAVNRWKLIEIFGRVLDKFMDREPSEQGLLNFLESMELRDFPDDDDKKEKVQLMTLHACKGLEWDAVIFMGVDEDLIPHRTLGSDIQEERRLFYVGVTRAKQRLLFTRTKIREKNGKRQPSAPSRFLLEIPKHLVKERSGQRIASKEQRRSILDAFYKQLEQKTLGEKESPT